MDILNIFLTQNQQPNTNLEINYKHVAINSIHSLHL